MAKVTRRLGSALTLGAAAALALLASVDRTAAGQPAGGTAVRPQPASSARAGATAVSRTAWGDPDLQGVWSSAPVSDVPFERSPALGTRAMLNDEEFARQREALRLAEESDRTNVNTNRDGRLAAPDNWRERGRPTRQASLVVDPPDGRLPPLTPDGAARAKRWRDTAEQPAGPEDLNPYDRCITRGVLGSALPNIYNSASRILQTPGYVVIHHEMIHETRLIPLDGRAHLPDGIRQYMGDARGRWDGTTLVIETTNFNGRTGSYGRNGNGNPTSTALRLVERYTRTGPSTLAYEATVHDPATYTASWRVAFPLTFDPDYRIFEYDCHEANYAVANMLRGARVREGQGSGSR